MLNGYMLNVKCVYNSRELETDIGLAQESSDLAV
jgi:hypothetical protein